MNIYTEPVVGDNFFAREDLLDSLSKSAADIKEGYRHNIAIIGQGLIGKSSLLLHFLGLIKNDNKLIPVYINIKGMSFADFVDNYINMVLYHSLKKRKEITRSDDLKYLFKCALRFFPKSCDLIKRIRALAQEGELDEAYSALWDLNVALSSESGEFLVIVWDEFNLISKFGLSKPFQVLGQKIMVQQKTLFILSSSSAVTAKKILAEKLSMLFGGFKTIDIGPFSFTQARAFMESQCKDINISNDIKDYLLSFTGGHPFYLSSIINRLKLTKFYGTQKVLPRHLGQVIAELLLYPGGLINQFFSDQLKLVFSDIPSRDIYDILKTILSTGRASDIVSRTVSSAKQILDLLDGLLDLGMISKSGSLYAVTDSVFRMWIEIKSKPRNLCFDFMPQEESGSYAKEAENKIMEFNAGRKRGLDDKLIELITSFKNDQFFIDERIRILPNVDYVRVRRLGQDGKVFVMRGKKDWLFVLPSRYVTDEYVYSLVQRAKAWKLNSAKIILLAPSGIDDTAKMIAKQKQLWVWGSQDINRLFLFFQGQRALIA
ncbi:MAG: ATP-binding protein [Candidatus Omnitrophota bacterium]